MRRFSGQSAEVSPRLRDIEGYVDPTEPLRDEGPFGDHTGYYTLPDPYSGSKLGIDARRNYRAKASDAPGRR